MMKLQTVGEAGLKGWREPVADKTAKVLSKRTPLRRDQVRTLFGLAFLVLSLLYVARAITQLARGAQQS